MKIFALIIMLSVISLASAKDDPRCGEAAFPNKAVVRSPSTKKYYTFSKGICYGYHASGSVNGNQFSDPAVCESLCESQPKKLKVQLPTYIDPRCRMPAYPNEAVINSTSIKEYFTFESGICNSYHASPESVYGNQFSDPAACEILCKSKPTKRKVQVASNSDPRCSMPASPSAAPANFPSTTEYFTFESGTCNSYHASQVVYGNQFQVRAVCESLCKSKSTTSKGKRNNDKKKHIKKCLKMITC